MLKHLSTVYFKLPQTCVLTLSLGSEVVCLFLLLLFWNPKKLGGMGKVFISVKTTPASAEKATHLHAASTEIHTATPWIAMSPAKPRICLEGLLRKAEAAPFPQTDFQALSKLCSPDTHLSQTPCGRCLSTQAAFLGRSAEREGHKAE